MKLITCSTASLAHRRSPARDSTMLLPLRCIPKVQLSLQTCCQLAGVACLLSVVHMTLYLSQPRTAADDLKTLCRATNFLPGNRPTKASEGPEFQRFAAYSATVSEQILEGDEGWLTVTFDRNGLNITEWLGYSDRHQKQRASIVGAYERLRPGCYGSFMVYTGDRPPRQLVFNHNGSYYQASFRASDGDNVGFPDYHFYGGSGENSFDRLVMQMQQMGRAPPTDPRAFWRGTVHSGTARELLTAYASYNQAVLDAQGVDWANASNYVSLPEHCKRGILVDMAGNRDGYSGRIKELLHCGRPLLIQDRTYWDWPSYKLRPWVHYVPFSATTTDVVDRARWLMENPEEARQIGKEGARFAAQYVSMRSAEDRIIELMLRECDST